MSIQALITRNLLKKSYLWNKPLDQIRTVMSQIEGGGIPDGIVMKKMPVAGVPCEVFHHADNTRSRTVLYFHGGGFCLGIYPNNRAFAAGLAKLLDAELYMPDYRLAPENPYPAALLDARAVYQTLSGGEDLIVMGDSSGCALELCALQGQDIMPSAIVMLTPVLDLSDAQERIAQSVRNDPFSLKDPLGLTKNYTAGCDAASPEISPVYGSLIGLAPVLIHAAQHDVFLSDACRFSQLATAAGVPVRLKIWKRMWHIFHMQAPFLPEAVRALDEVRAFIDTIKKQR